MYVTLGMKQLCKYIENRNWYTNNLYIFLYIFHFTFYKNIVNLKPKYWDYEKNMGFHLTSKFKLLLVEPWGMRLQWKHPTLSKSTMLITSTIIFDIQYLSTFALLVCTLEFWQ